MESARWDFPVNSVRVCLDQKQPEPAGTIWAAAYPESVRFSGTRELIARINRMFDRIGQPQTSHVIRSFREDAPGYTAFDPHPARCYSAQELLQKRGALGEIDMILHSRRHAEWQGTARSADGSNSVQFNSTLSFLDWLAGL